MSARYGCPPSELLRLPADELNLNILIFQKALFHRENAIKRLVNRRVAKSEADLLVKILNIVAYNAG